MKLPVFLPGLLALVASAFAEEVATLPGTRPLTMTGDLSAQMHEAALRDMDRRIADAPAARAKFWHRDFSSRASYEDSVEPNREHLKQILGIVDKRLREVELWYPSMERVDEEENPALVAETGTYRIWQIRWPVLKGVNGEGLLLEPSGKPIGLVVAVPDADQTPEQIAGLAPGVPEESQFARHLVEDGFVVVVPALINRLAAEPRTWNPMWSNQFRPGESPWNLMWPNQSRREWIHRQAFMMGRTLIGLELQKIRGATDWLGSHYMSKQENLRVGLAGYGEGGLLAFHGAALDNHVQSTLVSGYFKSREHTWQEPLYRNVWSLLREYGDAEIATLIAPRTLVVEYSPEPAVNGPPPLVEGAAGKNNGAPGKLATPPFTEVEAEFKRIAELLPPQFQNRDLVHGPDGSTVAPGSAEALARFERGLATETPDRHPQPAPADRRVRSSMTLVLPEVRQSRQVDELETFIQELVRVSHDQRDEFMLRPLVPEYQKESWTLQLNYAALPSEKATAAAGKFRQQFWEDILGKIEDPLPPPNPRTRKIYDEPKWTGYEVVVDVDHEGFAWGILCVPKDLKPGERRPVVVCQHGRHGLPQDVITGDQPAYRNFAARLADQGFITFAPHNLYQKEEYYRMLSRKGNTIGLSMFSVIVRHHEQWLKWLSSLPFVDPQRIAFYGLSYGGESAVRIPPLLDGYCLSICSGDFNDWPRKVASTDDRHSFMFTDEWEMPYFNMGNTFGYAELTYLMFPRPFMVERGHHDQVAPDEWVASEYAKTRWFYDQFGLGDRTAIEFFNGGHTINGQGTFGFLHKHLRWPEEPAK